ncbi:TPA: hypothetical protein DEQ22_00235 [Candidatus Nomurabacteria bacterium]|uniref:ATP synthase subunit delta n=2 Tax=Candidatus Nomuraibacteriota TaxID=1752729 RepID=A0A1F6YM29_9BACT|nr:MAG: hypothetical protein UV13_C0001G0109 [Parcubacteria group bacterium GW2011_GWC1_42_21]KKS57975.1 MAG: hypothetical protein UV23_C0019G0042 [Candidatus Nomurabacteria bacterium GW2011_GWF1_42_40]KKT00672.1 MAG: hypothetical protein UV77_C0001G0043 [Candidatus Nomurabacteria bacterium GW2011_GWA1_43_17]KKT07651.1 MAG: hypothetical protein UV85_C0008G0022 [Candidatus Nomurabacteria bacterium GW2011_GWB1_43_19]KKT11831.1 MAG: hypothetical protein UV91_C0001G0043 [Candidatus Nomurabacteria b
MATLSNKDIANAIYGFLKDKNGSRDAFREVVKFLQKKRLLGRSKAILESLRRVVNEEEGELEAEVQSVRSLPDKNKKEISEFLKRKYGAKQLILKESLDAGLLGGFRIEVKDEVIDLTSRNKLRKLQAHLTKSA